MELINDGAMVVMSAKDFKDAVKQLSVEPTQSTQEQKEPPKWLHRPYLRACELSEYTGRKRKLLLLNYCRRRPKMGHQCLFGILRKAQLMQKTF